jgi:hypothetical protein
MPLKSKFFFMILFSLAAGASNKVGNGGNIVSCQDKSGATLLDFYESHIVAVPQTKAPSLTPEKIAEIHLEKIRSADSKLADQYLKRLHNMMKEVDFLEEAELTTIDDSKHLYQPANKNCKVLQTAVRKKSIVANEKRFLIRKDLWEKLDSINKAGLLTHEIIYEHFSQLGEEDSVKARKLNAFLYQDDFVAKDFWKLIKQMEIPIYP